MKQNMGTTDRVIRAVVGIAGVALGLYWQTWWGLFALIPLLTQFGTSFGALLGGAIVTEQVFVINGVGTYLVNAINTRNYPVVQSTVVVIAALFVLVNLAIDLVYLLVDPRISYQ